VEGGKEKEVKASRKVRPKGARGSRGDAYTLPCRCYHAALKFQKSAHAKKC
jgi:hypothetical protein